MGYTEDEPKTTASVVIVGAGPVGMLTALRLGQAGIDTLVIEGHETLLETTRAVVYMPMVIPVLRELGILDTVLKQAYLNTEGVVWRDIDGNVLAHLPLSSTDPDEVGGVLLAGQWRMNAIIQEELKKYPSVQVQFGLKIASIKHNTLSSPSTTITTVSTRISSPQTTTLTATYILGTDGANSTTRNLLNLPFVGTSYTNLRMIGVDAIYDFTKHHSYTPLNFIVHPTDWAVIAYTGQHENNITHETAILNNITNPQWRVAYVEAPHLPDDSASILARARSQMQKYTQGSNDYHILRAEPYTMHQRHASVAIVDRIALAGDALHSNNPIGGLGLTGGILDAFCYGNALIRVIRGEEPYDVLKACAESRLNVWKTTTDGLSRANLERLLVSTEGEGGSQNEAVARREGLFQGLNGDSKGEVAARVRGAMQGMMGDDFGVGVDRWVSVNS